MGCDTYSIIDTESGITVAKSMPIETAIIMLKALFLEYWQEPGLKYTIKRERMEANDD